MHPQAREFVAAQVAAHGPFASVVEFGSRDINGGVRDLFGDAVYTGVDVESGPGVDVVADVVAYSHPRKVACVVCCEVLEHTDNPWGVIVAAESNLRRGGVLILTAAADPRAPHSAVDGGPLRDGEHYANIVPADLARWLEPFSHAEVWHDTAAGDVRAVAVR